MDRDQDGTIKMKTRDDNKISILTELSEVNMEDNSISRRASELELYKVVREISCELVQN